MFIKDFAFSADDNGIEFVMYEEKTLENSPTGTSQEKKELTVDTRIL